MTTDVLAHLATIAAAQRDLPRLVAEARRTGASWQQIGDALGVSRQAAQQRFGT